ncbi:tyrosine-type recombinase/integrase [uncultured Ruminobacter sp.]|uniref:tyrosine-type recombinase/integrase n=1 Tax=uncultured Ruminobacter sp. TaxID=538947 RepID=UPI002608CDA0|nr:tyrosine-type recombinase/integrase [uncultured Ruminobacter sp.]
MNNEVSIEKLASDFLDYKHALGYTYRSQTCIINRYVAFHISHEGGIVPVKNIVHGFLEEVSDSTEILRCYISVLREFCKYLYSVGYEDTYIIRNKAGSTYTPNPPYFFTKSEIESLFYQIDSVKKTKEFKGREIVIPVLYRLMYCCGLRCKEVRTLKAKDVHMRDLYIDIIQSKGPIDRRIFIDKSLAEYLEAYEEKISLLFPDRIYFFPHGNKCYESAFVSRNFRLFWLQAFPETAPDAVPRAYDLRHHFAWSNLNRWVAEGEDVNVKLPYLMRYMGHKNIKSTLYYFHFVPEFYSIYKEIANKTSSIVPEVPHEKEN